MHCATGMPSCWHGNTEHLLQLGKTLGTEAIQCLQMPPMEEVKTLEYLRQLTAQTHSKMVWEVGASCNFLIAAARMGLSTAAVANLGEDGYGQFLLDVLKVTHLSLEPCAGAIT